MLRLVSTRELGLAIYGAWRFARLDRSARELFENSEDAFWKSFNAALVAAPFYFTLIMFGVATSPEPVLSARLVAVEIITYVIGWLLFPLVILAVVDSYGRSEFYWRFIAAWNWSVVLQALLLSTVAYVTSWSSVMAGIFSVLVTVYILIYQGFIARIMLEIRVRHAAMVVLLDVGLAIGLRMVSGMLHNG